MIMKQALQHILCIDDETDILEVARMCLETVGGYQVSICSSGAEAVAKVDGIKPDLIMIDVMMPGMDGPATMIELKKNPALAKTPIVFMTARIQPTEIREYLVMGASAVLPKPFDPMTLSSQIQEIWDKHAG